MKKTRNFFTVCREDCLRGSNPQRGQVALGAAIVFCAIALATSLGMSTPALREIKTIDAVAASRQSSAAAESVVEDVALKALSGSAPSGESLMVGNASAMATAAGDPLVITSTASSSGAVRNFTVIVEIDSSTTPNGFSIDSWQEIP